MNRIYNKDKNLESHRFFSYIAWATVVLFAIFVYNITMDLKETTHRLQTKVDSLETKVNTPTGSITDFET